MRINLFACSAGLALVANCLPMNQPLPTMKNTEFTTAGVQFDPANNPLHQQLRELSPRYAEGMMQSFIATPEFLEMEAGESLFKLVPSGSAVSPYSPYFMSKEQLHYVRRFPEDIVRKLALPAMSWASNYDIYEVKVKEESKAIVLRGEIAPGVHTYHDGESKDIVIEGGGEQMVVPNRDQFNEPVKMSGQVSILGIRFGIPYRAYSKLSETQGGETIDEVIQIASKSPETVFRYLHGTLNNPDVAFSMPSRESSVETEGEESKFTVDLCSDKPEFTNEAVKAHYGLAMDLKAQIYDSSTSIGSLFAELARRRPSEMFPAVLSKDDEDTAAEFKDYRSLIRDVVNKATDKHLIQNALEPIRALNSDIFYYFSERSVDLLSGKSHIESAGSYKDELHCLVVRNAPLLTTSAFLHMVLESLNLYGFGTTKEKTNQFTQMPFSMEKPTTIPIAASFVARMLTSYVFNEHNNFSPLAILSQNLNEVVNNVKLSKPSSLPLGHRREFASLGGMAYMEILHATSGLNRRISDIFRIVLTITKDDAKEAEFIRVATVKTTEEDKKQYKPTLVAFFKRMETIGPRLTFPWWKENYRRLRKLGSLAKAWNVESAQTTLNEIKIVMEKFATFEEQYRYDVTQMAYEAPELTSAYMKPWDPII